MLEGVFQSRVPLWVEVEYRDCIFHTSECRNMKFNKNPSIFHFKQQYLPRNVHTTGVSQHRVSCRRPFPLPALRLSDLSYIRWLVLFFMFRFQRKLFSKCLWWKSSNCAPLFPLSIQFAVLCNIFKKNFPVVKNIVSFKVVTMASFWLQFLFTIFFIKKTFLCR